MLSLTRKAGQGICIGPSVYIYIASIRRGEVRIRIKAPIDMVVTRAETGRDPTPDVVPQTPVNVLAVVAVDGKLHILESSGVDGADLDELLLGTSLGLGHWIGQAEGSSADEINHVAWRRLVPSEWARLKGHHRLWDSDEQSLDAECAAE